ncbi:MAG: N-6 DNA methylase, partial [Candidatus Nitrosocaldus sp.]
MIDDMQPTSIDLDMIANCLRQAARNASNEEELRIHATRCIEDHILKSLGISSYSTKHEYTLISGARVDSLYGHVVIEYKAPGRLSQASEIAKAKEQVIMYIKELEPNKQGWGRYLGIIISDRLAFVRYYDREDRWLLRGAYELSRESVVKLVEAIRGLKRKSLNADNLLSDFGAESNIARDMVKTLYSKLLASKGSGKVALLYNEWARLFKQATGYDVEKLKGLEKEYGIKAGSGNGKSSVDYDALLFSIHTYYALLMKVLAAEMVYLYGMKFLKSFVLDLNDAYMSRSVEGLKFELEKLEKGEIFRNLLALDNFLEGDYFSWYLEVMDDQLASDIANMLRKLDEYELATPQLEPEFARDLLKRLYQHLLPRNIRHQLGEYYTPDWLAEFLLDEVGLSLQRLEEIGKSNSFKPLEIRVLDPACGSGTFLVAYIKRLRMYAEEHYLHDVVGEYILRNVVGYDLNPLAVLASRTNYLLSIADLLHYIKGRREIPVYLADSLMIEQRGSMQGINYVIKTSIGEFQIPVSIVNNGKLTDLLNEVILCMSKGYKDEEFRLMINHITSNDNEVETLCAFYRMLIDLKRNKRDDIWIGIIRNAFAPLLKGEFDYVVGNPPWINWESLPEEYRESSRYLWDRYKLLGIRGKTALGKVKRDLSMLFLIRSLDIYLKDNEDSKLAFLLPFTLFKTQAGAGFRNYIARNTIIECIHDMVTLKPFEGAVNRTSAIILRKISTNEKNIAKNSQGIKHVIWNSEREIPVDSTLEQVLGIVDKYDSAIMIPLDTIESPWMQINRNSISAVKKIVGKSSYEAHEGVLTGLNQVYYVKILERQDNHLIITNPPESGQKKSVEEVTARVEADLVYPLIRGRDVKKWYVEFKDRYVIVPHNNKGKPLSEVYIKQHYPCIYDYLHKFKNELSARSIHRLWGKNNPFYSLYDIGNYTFASYKVVWKRIAGAITGKAV